MIWNRTKMVLHLQKFYRYGVNSAYPHYRKTKQRYLVQQTIRNSFITLQQDSQRSLSFNKCIYRSNILKQTPRGDSITQRCFSNGTQIQDDGRHDETITKLVEHYQTDKEYNRRANVILPCGYGKTNLAIKMLDEFYNGSFYSSSTTIPTAVYVTPTLELVKQTRINILKSNIIEEKAMWRIASSSDGDYSNRYTTTDPENIREWFLLDNTLSKRLFLTTYKSLPRIREAMKYTPTKSIGLGIFDEAHHMEGNSTEIEYGLFDTNIPMDYRLFMTGTPRNPYSKDNNNKEDDSDGDSNHISAGNPEEVEDSSLHVQPLVRKFKNETLFGPTIVEKTYKDSEEKGITVPIKLLVISHEEVRMMLQKEGIEVDDTRRQGREYWLSFFLQCAFLIQPDIRHVLSFHSTNIRAQCFETELKKCSDVHVYQVDGTMTPRERKKVLDAAASKPRSVIANCRVFSTGVDWKWDLVYMADMVNKPYLVKQIIGRVSRPSASKDQGYVLVPLLHREFENGGDDETFDESMMMEYNINFESLVVVFEAMLECNSDLAEAVESAYSRSRSDDGKHRHSSDWMLFQDSFRLPEGWTFEQKRDCMMRVVMEVGRKRVNNWDMMLGLLKQFEKRENHCTIPQNHVEEGVQLGNWLNKQRHLMKKGKLLVDRQEKLESIGMVWDPLEEQWNGIFQLLESYQKQKGECNVPQNHVEEGMQLGQWLNVQRQLMKKGKLPVERQQKLETLGVVWDPLEEQWNSMFQLLESYQKQKGECDVPSNHVEEGKKLGNWLDNQRHLMKKGKLPVERQQKLETLGVVWDPFEEQWNSMLQLLESYQKQKGDCNVPSNHVEAGKQLGKWLHRQRKLMKKGKLPVERQQKLETLGVIWDPLEEQWNSMFELFKSYQKQKGDCNVPSNHVEAGKKLGNWLDTQRQLLKKGKLPVDRQQKLETIGVVWDPSEEQWNFMLELLKSYNDREGNFDIPNRHTENSHNLGRWFAEQRY